MSYKWNAKIDEQQKEQQQKQWMDKIIFSSAMNSAMNEKNDDKRTESKDLWTTKTILILVVYTPIVFRKPTSLVGSILIYWKWLSTEMLYAVT